MPVNSCSSIGSPSKVHSFFWASMIAVVSRAISRFSCSSRRFCAVVGLTFGPRCTAAWSALANCLRQVASIELYTRSVFGAQQRAAITGLLASVVIAQDSALLGSRNQPSALDGHDLWIRCVGGGPMRCLGSIEK
jgi:hypothetical protein